MTRQLFILTVFVGLTAVSCGQTKKEITTSDIKGRWNQNETTSYNTLVFSDRTVFVDNRVDTIFTLNYSLSQDTLITWSDEKQKRKSKIISITKDNLVLDGIGGWTKTIAYSKVKDK